MTASILPEDVDVLTQQQIEALTNDDIAGLSAATLAAFSVDQLGWLTDAQKLLVTLAQLQELTAEQLNVFPVAPGMLLQTAITDMDSELEKFNNELNTFSTSLTEQLTEQANISASASELTQMAMWELLGRQRTNAPSSDNKCKECVFFAARENGNTGRCRRMPETINKEHDDMCGEFVRDAQRLLTDASSALEDTTGLMGPAQTAANGKLTQYTTDTNSLETLEGEIATLEQALDTAKGAVVTAEAAVDAARFFDLTVSHLEGFVTVASDVPLTAAVYGVAIKANETKPKLFPVTGSAGTYAINTTGDGLPLTVDFSSVRTAIEAIENSFADITGIDVSNDLTTLKASVTNKKGLVNTAQTNVDNKQTEIDTAKDNLATSSAEYLPLRDEYDALVAEELRLRILVNKLTEEVSFGQFGFDINAKQRLAVYHVLTTTEYNTLTGETATDTGVYVTDYKDDYSEVLLVPATVTNKVPSVASDAEGVSFTTVKTNKEDAETAVEAAAATNPDTAAYLASL